MRTTDWAAQRLRLASRTFINLDRISRDSGELFRKPSPTTLLIKSPSTIASTFSFTSFSSYVSFSFFFFCFSNSFLQDPAIGSVHPKVKSEKTYGTDRQCTVAKMPKDFNSNPDADQFPSSVSSDPQNSRNHVTDS